MPRNRLWFAGKKNHPKCCDGTPDSDVCHDLSFLEADRSDFHDRSLIDATQDINKIFMRLEERPPRDRDERLRQAACDVAETLGLAARQDDRFHYSASSVSRSSVSASAESGEEARPMPS